MKYLRPLSLFGPILISRALIAVTPPPHPIIMKTFETRNLRKVELSIQEGEVQIQGDATTDKAIVTVTKGDGFSPACKLTVDTVGKTLRVLIEKTPHSGAIKCDAQIQVKLPRDVELDLQAGAGSISVLGTRGAITYNLGAGDVKLDAEISKLKGFAGSATVEAKGLTGSAQITGGAVTLTATYLTVPPTGTMDIKIGSGTSTIYLPAGSILAPPKLEAGVGKLTHETGVAGTGVGKLTNEAPTALGAYLISMEVGTGDLVIRTLPQKK